MDRAGGVGGPGGWSAESRGGGARSRQDSGEHEKGLGFHRGTVRAIRGLKETLFVKHAMLSLESSQPLVCRNCSAVTRLLMCNSCCRIYYGAW